MKKSKRGAANIRQFNAEREERNIALIKDELKKARRLKLEFKSLGKLAEYVSATTRLHRTSLTRNTRYKGMLTDYLFYTGGALEKISDTQATPEILRAKLTAAKLESSNLRQRVKRLEATASTSIETHRPEAGPNRASPDEDYIAFVDTAMALTALLERMQDTVVVNMKERTIEDLAAPPSKRVIVGPERTTAYVTWLRKQQRLLLNLPNVS